MSLKWSRLSDVPHITVRLIGWPHAEVRAGLSLDTEAGVAGGGAGSGTAIITGLCFLHVGAATKLVRC